MYDLDMLTVRISAAFINHTPYLLHSSRIEMAIINANVYVIGMKLKANIHPLVTLHG